MKESWFNNTQKTCLSLRSFLFGFSDVAVFCQWGEGSSVGEVSDLSFWFLDMNFEKKKRFTRGDYAFAQFRYMRRDFGRVLLMCLEQYTRVIIESAWVFVFTGVISMKVT